MDTDERQYTVLETDLMELGRLGKARWVAGDLLSYAPACLLASNPFLVDPDLLLETFIYCTMLVWWAGQVGDLPWMWALLCGGSALVLWYLTRIAPPSPIAAANFHTTQASTSLGSLQEP